MTSRQKRRRNLQAGPTGRPAQPQPKGESADEPSFHWWAVCYLGMAVWGVFAGAVAAMAALRIWGMPSGAPGFVVTVLCASGSVGLLMMAFIHITFSRAEESR